MPSLQDHLWRYRWLRSSVSLLIKDVHNRTEGGWWSFIAIACMWLSRSALIEIKSPITAWLISTCTVGDCFSLSYTVITARSDTVLIGGTLNPKRQLTNDEHTSSFFLAGWDLFVLKWSSTVYSQLLSNLPLLSSSSVHNMKHVQAEAYRHCVSKSITQHMLMTFLLN